MSQPNDPELTAPLEDGSLETTHQGEETENTLPDFLQIQKQAFSTSRAVVFSEYMAEWPKIYRSMRNEHTEGSKYRKRAYRSRSKIFRPKTQSAVRKNLASTASSLFSTADAVQVQPEYEDGPESRAQAKFLHELTNYRLSRNSRRNGISWFKTVIGARYDTQVTGVCISKQFWERKTRKEIEIIEVEMIDEETGETFIEEQEHEKVIPFIDRPQCLLYPPEGIIIDSAANWVDPIQTAAFLYVPHPMNVDDVLTRMEEQNEEDPGANWEPLTSSEVISLGSGKGTNSTSTSVKQARDKIDRQGNDAQSVSGYENVQVYECFVHHRGEDYHYWSLGPNKMLTDPRPVRESYPWAFGDRPYVMGNAQIEPHRLYPQSPAEAWRPLQDEANELANLRLDTLKQIIAPITKVKRGRNVDTDAVQRRGPHTTLMLNNMDDVVIEKPPSLDGNAYNEAAHINADFDELAGVFSASSVQTNRSMNETVGGMQLMSGSANGLTEFDLRIFGETWVEPVVRQIVMLEQYYESDANILKIAGQRAMLRQKYGINDLTDEFMMKEVFVSVDIGIGASDPMQKQQKLATALGLLEKTLPLWKGKVEFEHEEIINEVWGVSGYKNGDRFIKEIKDEAPKPEPDPSVMIKKMELEQRQKEAEAKNALEEKKQRTDMIVEVLKASQSQEKIEMDKVQQQAGFLSDLVSKLQGSGKDMPPAPPPANAPNMTSSVGAHPYG